jgi:hypothetical protein
MPMWERIRAEAQQSALSECGASAERQESALAGETAMASPAAFQERAWQAQQGKNKRCNTASRWPDGAS